MLFECLEVRSHKCVEELFALERVRRARAGLKSLSRPLRCGRSFAPPRVGRLRIHRREELLVPELVKQPPRVVEERLVREKRRHGRLGAILANPAHVLRENRRFEALLPDHVETELEDALFPDPCMLLA